MNLEIGLTFDAQLQQCLLKVARRADQLARRTVELPIADRQLWLRAELEVFEEVELSAGGILSRAA